MSFKPPFASEADLHFEVERFFKKHNVPFLSKYALPDGGECDMVLLNTEGGEPVCVLEFKNGLNLQHTSVAHLASHFEQCLKYHLKTKLPVFLGPYFTPTASTMGYFSGGARASATAAFSAYGGRMNVGLFFIEARQAHVTKSWASFTATLRQKRVVHYRPPTQYGSESPVKNAWPVDEKIKLVDFMGAASKKVRAAA